jgi:hydroxymethylbilane synthase
MSELPSAVRLGTRASALARWQTDYVAALLQRVWPALRTEVKEISTRGDRILDTALPLVGGKGLFTAELEAALRGGTIDLAVHSLKDLPTPVPPGLAIGAIPRRANPADVLVSRHDHDLDSLPAGATIGTSSRRRAAQLLHWRPDLHLADVRGNVDTRVRKALDPDGPYSAIVLAHAGLDRLGRLDVVSQLLPIERMLPAPGQGALGVQCRDEAVWRALLAPINERESAAATTAERAFLAGLGGGCAVPISAYARAERGRLQLRGRVSAQDGSDRVDVDAAVALEADEGRSMRAAERLGSELARMALERGAATLLEVAA